MGSYVVSLRHEKRQSGSSVDAISREAGVHVIRASARGGLVIEAQGSTIIRLEKLYESDFIIEPEILHVSL